MFDRIESILIVMAHQVLSDDYCSLEKCLENDLPFSASAFYLVKQLRKGSLKKRMVWVDSWPGYSVVVVSDDQHKTAGSQRVYCFCRDTKSTLVLDAVLQHVMKLLSNTLFLFGLSSEVLDKLISHRSTAYRICIDAFMMNMPVEHISQIPIPDGLTVTTLKQEHVEIVVQEWPYSGTFSDCKEWVSDMIKQFPSVCIENEQGDPVAWILQQDYGCIGMLHVVPEYRRAKLGSAVTMLLLEKLLKEGDYIYSSVSIDNETSLAFHERNNFEYIRDFSIGYVMYPYEEGLQK